ncbi:hypothetical protein CRE_19737 [Caenorhabditis remanei]|uniref:DUF38 domain-containing protein n=1 Tax=Caenorhabditis remanei TaxID=31234 RepID=E3MTI6_CAERE|nr:hypothetical protein CRE_19737 [Caenorhabditis remanei]
MEIPKNNPTAIGACIIYQFHKRNSCQEAYQKFCAVFGSDSVDFESFSYYFSQFLRGNLDINYNRGISKNQKLADILKNDSTALRACILYEIAQSSSFVESHTNFCDTIKSDFVKMTDFEYYWNAGNKKKEIPDRLPKTPPSTKLEYDLLDIYIGDGYVDLSADGIDQIFDNTDYLKDAFEELKLFSENAEIQEIRLHLNSISEKKDVELFHSIFKKSIFLAKSVYIKTFYTSQASSILKFFDSKKLGNFEIQCSEHDGRVHSFFEIEHFRKVKNVSLRDFGVFDSAHLDYFHHFDSFEIRIISISASRIVRLRDALSKSANFKTCCILSGDRDFDVVSVGRALGTAHPDENHWHMTYRHLIDGVDGFLVFEIYRTFITVNKIC